MKRGTRIHKRSGKAGGSNREQNQSCVFHLSGGFYANPHVHMWKGAIPSSGLIDSVSECYAYDFSKLATLLSGRLRSQWLGRLCPSFGHNAGSISCFRWKMKVEKNPKKTTQHFCAWLNNGYGTSVGASYVRESLGVLTFLGRRGGWVDIPRNTLNFWTPRRANIPESVLNRCVLSIFFFNWIFCSPFPR